MNNLHVMSCCASAKCESSDLILKCEHPAAAVSVTIGLHQLVGGSTCPRYLACCVLIGIKIHVGLSFIWARCCHLTLWFRLMEPKSQSKSKRAIGQSKLWLKQKDWTFTSCWTRMKAAGNEKQTKPVEYIFASKRKGERFVQILRDLFRTKLLDNQTESSQVIIGDSSLKKPKKQKKDEMAEKIRSSNSLLVSHPHPSKKKKNISSPFIFSRNVVKFFLCEQN